VRETKAENASGLNQTKATPEFGVLYRPIKYFSVYGNYSKTFTPNYVLDANNQQLGPTTGKGYDIGVKTELLEGKLSATVAIYKADYLNIPVEDFPREAETNIRPLYNLGGAQRSAGLEMDVFYSPTKNNQVVASFSNSWEHRTLVSTTVLQDNVPLANVPKYNFNLWNKYSFDTGILKGAFVGVGMKAVSRMRLHPSYDVGIFGRGYVTFDASAGYSWKTKAGTWSARVNVENLTNQSYFNGVYQLGDPLTVKGTIRWSF
jgi:iron complex outermembrane receptor protein